MRIGLVTQSYYPVLGGVTEHVYHLGRELQQRGHQVTVVTGSARQADDRGLRVVRHGIQIPLTVNGATMHATFGWRLGRVLQRIEAAEQFDLVHIQSPTDPGLPLLAAKVMRTPKVGTHHSWRDNPIVADLTFRAFRMVFDDAVAKVQRHLAVSPGAAAAIHRYYPRLPIEIIPNGVDTERFSPSVKPFPQYRDGVFTILFVGRMDPRKGAKYLFSALPYVEQQLPTYRVLVVGKGWMKKYYHTFVPLHLRRRVIFAGYATPEELPRYYRSADVYCSPATGNESFGIVLLEAMASGVPVVAADIEGYRHVMTDGREGLFARPRDPYALAQQLVSLAHQPERRQRLAQAGRQTATQYDWRNITDRIEAVYRQVVPV
ncbi:MAG: glycosyltransferase family 4 protein [Candidatus Kerfeldbacteria bacterium]|nr:glycosyltransferase family 4 protein [Candidatus Kerfeldbacteria bacterium]